MSESIAASGDSSSGGQFSPMDLPATVSAGSLLRSARESHGLHIAALAVALKVPVKKLEALESDRYDLLPDAVFTRALAASVCRTLKIEAAPVLERLPQKGGEQLGMTGGGINAPFRGSSDGSRPSALSQISRPAMLAGIALLLGALVLIFLPSLKVGVEEAKASLTAIVGPIGGAAPLPADTTQVNASEPGKTLAEESVNTALQESSSDGQPSSANPGTTAATSGGSIASQTSSTLSSVAAGLMPATPASRATDAAPDSAKGIVVFTAKSTSWVEVTDSTRQVVLRRTLNPGESAGANGSLPLSVIVGRADATDVLVRGKVFDLSTFSKSNVARFEVTQ